MLFHTLKNKLQQKLEMKIISKYLFGFSRRKNEKIIYPIRPDRHHAQC
jgi:hypothetical protein